MHILSHIIFFTDPWSFFSPMFSQDQCWVIMEIPEMFQHDFLQAIMNQNLFQQGFGFLDIPSEFRFFLLSSSLCRIWTYQSKTLTVLQSRKLAEAIFTFFMWKLRGSAFCRNLSLCLLHFVWTTYKDIVYRHILRFIRCNCFTWAVVNTSWQRS